MKYLALIALATMSLGLGACTRDEPAYTTSTTATTTTTTASTGYSK